MPTRSKGYPRKTLALSWIGLSESSLFKDLRRLARPFVFFPDAADLTSRRCRGWAQSVGVVMAVITLARASIFRKQLLENPKSQIAGSDCGGPPRRAAGYPPAWRQHGRHSAPERNVLKSAWGLGGRAMTERTAAVLAAGAAARSRHAGADKDRTAARPAFCRGAPALWRLAAFLLALSFAAQSRGAEYYGYDQGGSRFAPLDEITPGNVDRLIPAWTYHTGDLASRAPDVLKRSKFEVTPILTADKLVACTPFNAVIALDPGNGARSLGATTPKSRPTIAPPTCSPAAAWRSGAIPAGAAGPCAPRESLTATADLRLIALDLKDGEPMRRFRPGWHGPHRSRQAAPRAERIPVHFAPRRLSATSSSSARRSTTTSGSTRRAASCAPSMSGPARSRWAWDPIPERAHDPDAASWGDSWRTDRRRRRGRYRDRRGARPDFPADH